jgi:hypothetical protein
MAIATLTQNESGANSLIDINNNFADLDTTKADLASPTFTGTPVFPTGSTGVTQSVNDNSTKLATTAYVDTAVASVVLPDNQLKVTTVTLSSSDILGLHTTPIQLLSAPGAGKINIVEEIIFFFDYGGVQYANGANLEVEYVGDTENLVPVLGNTALTGTSDTISLRSNGTNTSASNVDISAGVNAAVEISTNGGTAYITGTGTLKAFIKYRIITL